MVSLKQFLPVAIKSCPENTIRGKWLKDEIDKPFSEKIMVIKSYSSISCSSRVNKNIYSFTFNQKY